MKYSLVKRDGVARLEVPFDDLTALLPNGDYELEIKRKTKPRSISQNNLLWLWYTCLEDNFGQPKEDYHAYYKDKFLSREIEINGRVVRVTRETKSLTTAQMSEFMTKIQADAATEFGVTLPLPEDRLIKLFIDQYQRK